jgi:hypothetical protein
VLLEGMYLSIDAALSILMKTRGKRAQQQSFLVFELLDDV